jgi:hypothetical protein
MRIRGLAVLLSLLVAACGREATPSVASDVAVDVASVAFDPRAQSPVLILSERQGTRRLPIWIGVAEARSIAQRLDDVSLPRPNTHDLARRLVEGLDGVVQRVTVTDLRDGTYYAVIALQRSSSGLRAGGALRSSPLRTREARRRRDGAARAADAHPTGKSGACALESGRNRLSDRSATRMRRLRAVLQLAATARHSDGKIVRDRVDSPPAGCQDGPDVACEEHPTPRTAGARA